MDNLAGLAGKKGFGLSGFSLKIIALVTMIIDHAGLIFDGYNGWDLTFMRVIGRIAFPLYAFLIAEGCRHTRDIKKYMLRLALFAALVQLGFWGIRMVMASAGTSAEAMGTLPDYNIFFTLLLGVLSAYGYDRLLQVDIAGRTVLCFVPFVAAAALAAFMNTDYDARGVLMIFMIYLAPFKLMQMAAMVICILILYGSAFNAVYWQWLFAGQGLYALMPIAALLSVALVGLYNGRRGRGWKWFFYIAYPGHFAVLFVIYLLFIGL